MPTTMVRNPNATSNNMSTASKIGAISGIASGISAIGSAYASKLTNDIRSIESKTAAARAKLQGNVDSMELTKQYNKTQATNAVMAAAQGRRGGSVDAIGSATESQLNWDTAFMKLSSDITYQSALSNAEGYKSAGKIGFGAGIASAGVGATTTTAKLYSIGGSTTKSKES